MNRKQRRALAKKNKKAASSFEGQMNMFERLPEQCLACDKSFDKENKNAVMTWNVVVRNDQKQVNLYCPECWKRAKLIIKEFQEKL